jgi:hypothetical protein
MGVKSIMIKEISADGYFNYKRCIILGITYLIVVLYGLSSSRWVGVLFDGLNKTGLKESGYP